MQFYKLEGFNKDDSWAQENENLRISREKARNLMLKSKAFNEKRKNKSFFYIVSALENTVTAGIISVKNIDLSKQIKLFLKALGLDLKDFCVEEITFNTTRTLLQTASRNNYIEDDDEILEQFDLDKLTGRFSRIIAYGENLIKSSNKKEIYKKSEKYLMANTLLPELDRIYAGKTASTATGHPVHYMVQTDDIDTRREICRLLLQALYANGRLKNKRYCFVDFRPGEEFPLTIYNQLYKSNIGGAIIVRYLANDDTEDDFANCGREIIESICETMKEYHNQVLTIFCLPHECTKSKDIFYENLGTTSFIELQEDLVTVERAESFLKMLAKEQHIRTDKNLFCNLNSEKKYLAPELRELFDSWYNQKLKTRIYPQYKEIVTVKHEVAVSAPKGSSYDELKEMIGLFEAKKVIDQALDYYKAQKLFSDKGMKSHHPAMHMVFTGAPGTAKTSVARLFAKIMKENRILSKGRLIEVGRGDLVGKYVGWTAPLIQKKFKEAEGSVLFIDEAYSLVDDREGSFGDEAINTIVQEMENHRENTIVIFAGYTDKMESFLQKNPGLRSRIAFHVPFENYSVEELCNIAKLIANKKGFSLEKQVQHRLTEIFEIAQKQDDFGNGRYVRNVIEKAEMAQASRLLAKGYEHITVQDIHTLCDTDFELPELKTEHKKCIGFSA